MGVYPSVSFFLCNLGSGHTIPYLWLGMAWAVGGTGGNLGFPSALRLALACLDTYIDLLPLHYRKLLRVYFTRLINNLIPCSFNIGEEEGE